MKLSFQATGNPLLNKEKSTSTGMEGRSIGC